MNDKQNINETSTGVRKKLKIEGSVPIRTVGIETKRERKNYSDLPPQNYIHVWWARRPTPATRLALLGSVLPESIDDEKLLNWIGITPNNKPPDLSTSEHVRRKKATVDDREGLVYEHYGYRKAYKNLPTEKEMAELHSVVKETWGGELPTVLDATAGGGSIPFESIRYGFPTIANELNPVASVILEAVLKHPRVNGDLSDDIRKWGEEINSLARDRLSEFFPREKGEIPLEYLWAHTISCPDCGLNLPLAPDWWLDKDSSTKGIAVRPKVEEESGRVQFGLVELPSDIERSEYNPTEGTVSYGKATCLRCNVTIEGDEIKEQAQNEEMGYQLYGIHLKNLSKSSGSGKDTFRTPTEEDIRAFERAEEKVQNDPELAALLSTEIPMGKETARTHDHGINQWRDMYSPRQLLSHYEYWQAFEELKPDIRAEHDDGVSEVILTFLAIAADKSVNYNSRYSSWITSRASVRSVFERHDFAFKWSFAESNLTAEGLGYEWVLDSIVEVYEELRELSGESSASVQVMQGDGSDLSIGDGDVDTIVLDPPYYDNVMYAELSDYFYVWLKIYLGDVFPDFFTGELTDKNSEAVANSAQFKEIAAADYSKSDLAKQDYEDKMTGIFAEMNRVLDQQGIFTLMFTHKKTDAWDTLTKALIDAGFVVTATHPVSTERPDSLHQAGMNAAESTILLSSEKRDEEPEAGEYTLWSEIKLETREVARNRAAELDQGDVEFTKVDVILASFGPTLEVFTKQYPVVDDEGNEVTPQTALDEARTAVRDYFIDKYLNEGVRQVDHKTEWYLLAWLVFEIQRFPYDEARRLAIGLGEDLDELKKTHRMWRKRSGDVLLRPHSERVQNIQKKPANRSGRKPVNPDDVSFATSLDKAHAAMHIYDTKGATEAWNWMNDRKCDSDPRFKATIEALLRVLPHDYEDWEIARDLAAGETGDLLNLDLDADIFEEEDDGVGQNHLTDYT